VLAARIGEKRSLLAGLAIVTIGLVSLAYASGYNLAVHNGPPPTSKTPASAAER
jgi:hypothetical protein